MEKSILRVIDPRLKINESKSVLCVQGSQQVSWQPQNAQSQTSTSNIQWQVLPPNPSVINRALYVQNDMKFTFTGTIPAGSTVQNLVNIGTTDSLRSYPLAQACNTMSVNINGNTVSMNPGQMISALQWFINKHDMADSLTGTGSQPDQYVNYADGYATVRNPLGSYGDNTDYLPRGALEYTVGSLTPAFNAGDPTQVYTQTVDVKFREPLFIPPFLYGHDANCEAGLPNVENLQIQLTMGDLSRMWSHADFDATYFPYSSTISSVNVVYNSAPVLLINYFTPNLLNNAVISNFPYKFDNYTLNIYSTSETRLAPGATYKLTSPLISVNTIPSRFYVFARQQDSDRTFKSSDSFAVITSANAIWNNRTGLFGSAEQHDLWKMSVNNGLQMTFPQFSKWVGSILCIEMGKDIGLEDNEAVGLSDGGKYQFQISVNIKNQTDYSQVGGSTVDYQLFVIPVLPGSLEILQGTCVQYTGLVTQAEVLESRLSGAPEYTFADFQDGQPFGGNVFNKIGKFFKGAYNKVIKPLKPLVRPILSVAAKTNPELAPFAQSAEMALDTYDAIKKTVDAAKRSQGVSGSGMYGSGMYGSGMYSGGMYSGGIPSGGMGSGGVGKKLKGKKKSKAKKSRGAGLDVEVIHVDDIRNVSGGSIRKLKKKYT